MPQGIAAIPNIYDPAALVSMISALSKKREGLDPMTDQLSDFMIDQRIDGELDRYLKDANLTQLLQRESNTRSMEFELQKLLEEMRDKRLGRATEAMKELGVVNEELGGDLQMPHHDQDAIAGLMGIGSRKRALTVEDLASQIRGRDTNTRLAPALASATATNSLVGATQAGFDQRDPTTPPLEEIMKGLGNYSVENSQPYAVANRAAEATVEAAEKTSRTKTAIGDTVYMVFNNDTGEEFRVPSYQAELKDEKGNVTLDMEFLKKKYGNNIRVSAQRTAQRELSSEESQSAKTERKVPPKRKAFVEGTNEEFEIDESKVEDTIHNGQKIKSIIINGRTFQVVPE